LPISRGRQLGEGTRLRCSTVSQTNIPDGLGADPVNASRQGPRRLSASFQRLASSTLRYIANWRTFAPPKQRRPLPPGVREVTDAANHRSHIPWKKQLQPQPTNILKHDDIRQMNDHLRDGAVHGGSRRKTEWRCSLSSSVFGGENQNRRRIRCRLPSPRFY
jgi:hypothetical protein